MANGLVQLLKYMPIFHAGNFGLQKSEDNWELSTDITYKSIFIQAIVILIVRGIVICPPNTDLSDTLFHIGHSWINIHTLTGQSKIIESTTMA